MRGEGLEAKSTSGRCCGAHCVDVLPNHMLVPVLLQRSEKQHEVEKDQQFQYLSSPSPPSSARIDSLSSRLLAEVATEVGLGT